MNASGRPNTCKSNGKRPSGRESGARVRNAYATCPRQRYSPEKSELIPHGPLVRHRVGGKAEADGDGHACH